MVMIRTEERVRFQHNTCILYIGAKIRKNNNKFVFVCVVDYEFAGQNIGSLGDYYSYLDPVGVIDGITNAWFNEYKIATLADIQKVTEGDR